MARNRPRLVVALAAVLLGAPLAAQQRGARSPRAGDYLSKRVVHVFDFEEEDENNYEQMPRYWFAVGGPGFPRHTADKTGFDKTQAVSGGHSFRLRSNGGSAAAVVEHGAIAAVPGADYMVTAKVRTAAMTTSRARMTAYFVDQHGRRIAPSFSQSELVKSNGRWSRLEVRLDGEFQTAAWIVLRLELLQADEFRPPTLGKHEIFKQDIGATAWFDDAVVFQLPRVRINSQTAVNVIRAPDRPRLTITVGDQTGEQLEAVVRVYDHLGRAIAEQKRVFAGRQAPTWQWTPPLERFGWYWADLRVNGERGVVGRRSVGLVWLAEPATVDLHESDRFGLVAEGMTDPERSMLRPMLERIGANRAIVDIWRGDRTLTLTAAESMPDDPIVNGLLADGRLVTLSMARAPEAIAEAANTDPHLALAVLGGDPAIWQPHVRPFAVTYAQPVQRWQVGAVGSDEAYWHKNLADDYHAFDRWLAGIVPNARTALPWSVQYALPPAAESVNALTLSIPTGVRPELIVPHLRAMDLADRDVAVVVERLAPAEFDHAERAADLAMRLIEAARADVGPVYIRYPWNEGEYRREPTAMPDPMLAVLANTIERLAGRRFVGEIELAEGVRGYILDGPAGGALIVWNESSPRRDVPFDLYLGDQPTAVDIWGNRSPLPRGDGKHRLTVGQDPVFIEGIDAQLARFRSMLRFDPAFVESSNRQHEIELVIANPWPRTITGKVLIDAIDKWSINPRLMTFAIPAGERRRMPMTLSFPVSELAGRKNLAARVELEADRRFDLDTAIPLTIGLRDVDFNATLSVEEETGDLLITSLVTNRGDEPRSLYAFVIAGDLARQQRIIATLEPNQTALKRFRLPGLRDQLAGRSVRVGLREMNGPAMINHLLDVP